MLVKTRIYLLEKLPRPELRHSGVLHGSANITRGPLGASGEGTEDIQGDKK